MIDEQWRLLEEPRSYAKQDILDFFGIPPHPEANLEQNIKDKRQFWGRRANGVSGRETAGRIKDWIQKLSKLLEDGEFPDAPIAHSADGTFRVLGDAQTPWELAEQLEMLLRQGDVSNVLAAASRALEKWPDDPEVLLSIALALSELLRDYENLAAEVTGLTDRVTSAALAASPTSQFAWLARARYALGTGALAEVDGIESRAATHGVTLPAEVHGILAISSFRAGNIDGGVRQLIRQVDVSGGDPAVRSVATDAIVQEVILPLLPITDRKAAAAYTEAVNVAAWLAQGVPESEAELIAFRVWAQQAVGGVFIGDLMIKSFLGVLTGFLALPLYGRAASRAGWRVLRDGPTNKSSWRQWILIADGEYVESMHSKAKRKFEWQQTVGEPWPNRDQVLARIERDNSGKR